MAEVHHFTHGWLNPGFAYAVSVIGALIGLYCTARARNLPEGAARIKWLTIATVAIGGAGFWLAHFTAMLGFDVVNSPVRYSPGLTAASLALSLAAAGVGLFLVGRREPTTAQILRAGAATGAGLLGMHYTGMAAVDVAGEIVHQPQLVALSALIAVVAATAALWFSVTVDGRLPMTGAAALMAAGVCGMHYTAMAAVGVRLDLTGLATVEGVRPLGLIVAVALVAAVTMTAMATVALQAMTTEEFDGDGPATLTAPKPAEPVGLAAAGFAAPTTEPIRLDMPITPGLRDRARAPY
ncbi:MHYT domain-containing protein [Asanoa siamensis]|uniref:MHYT domain-containing signal sensor n=1 Tax=Asanoa siamensis TaxID=926357 RepID=A0ABQ4CIG2_9ACTN|nr:MHYT domain-containing protein [Asanoa siamensis]GIF70597.1 MHYT domain-containing signal sensor [Asanoa siamensis]